MGRRRHPAEFRSRVLDLVNVGRKVVDLARDLGVSEQPSQRIGMLPVARCLHDD